MLKTRIVWQTEQGAVQEISSGAGVDHAIQSVSITQCVNSEKELSPGAVCASLLEVKILTVAGSIPLQAGTQVSVYRHDGAQEHFAGVYVVEQPQQMTAHTVKITGYDLVTRLDKDLSLWLQGLDGWPYTLRAFADMVCGVCGLKMRAGEIPNGEFLVNRFTRDCVTGRQLMQWVGQLCCRFCRVSEEDPAAVEFDWYKPSGKVIDPSGELYYLKNNLSFENYGVAPVDVVQMRLSGAEGGALWPEAGENDNCYVIAGNPLLSGSLQADIVPALQRIQAELAGFSYTPCKVTIPACPDIRPGHTVTVTTKDGKQFTTCVMTKTQSGQKDILESNGSYRRDAATAGKASEKEYAELAAGEAQNAASSAADAAGAAQQAADSAENAAQSAALSAAAAGNAAQEAVNRMTHEEIFNKLTKDGTIQGIYVQDDKWYINAELAKIVNLIADHVKSVSGALTMEIDGAKLVLKTDGSENIVLTNEFYGYPIFRMTNTDNEDVYFGQECSLQTNELRIGGKVDSPMFRVFANLLTGNSEVHLGSIFPSGTGNCKWEYIPSLGKTMLVQQ